MGRPVGGQASLIMFIRKIKSSLPVSLLLAALFMPQLLPAQLDTNDRWIVRDFYNYVYPFGTDADLGWTGAYDGDNSTAGTVSAEWQKATRMRINFYRHLGGLTPNITFDAAKSAASQESALILSDTKILNHNPLPQNSVFWTAGGQEAAQKGNIAIGSIGFYAVDGYMLDSGSENIGEPNSFWNEEVGHRRWILYPQADVMGSGDVPGTGFQVTDFWAANTIWVQPANPFVARPATRDDFVAWPPPGYVPADLVWPRWSLSYPGADFSSATVTMNGNDIPLIIEYFTEPENINAAPEPSIVWIPNSMDRTTNETWPIGETDEEIAVSVDNVTVGGQPVGPFNYTVKIFNPANAGASEVHTTIEAPLEVAAQAPAALPVVQSRSWSEGFQGRLIGVEPFADVFDAEDGLGTMESATSGTYNVVISGRPGNATSVYRLLQANEFPQVVGLPGTYLVGANQPELSFLSSISYATGIQIAEVQVNAGDGYNWQTVWSKSEPVEFVGTFDQETIDLSDFANRTIAIRFKYSLTGPGSWFGQDEAFVGWAFDDITLGDVQQVTDENLNSIEYGANQITVTFPDTAPTYVQAREIAFSEMGNGGFALDWGPAIMVTPQSGGFTLLGTPVGTWTEHAIASWINGSENADWVYSYHLKWLYVPEGSWLHTGIGWVKVITGDIQTGLWLYHPGEGFIYVQRAYPGQYLRSPFTGEPGTRGSFNP